MNQIIKNQAHYTYFTLEQQYISMTLKEGEKAWSGEGCRKALQKYQPEHGGNHSLASSY